MEIGAWERRVRSEHECFDTRAETGTSMSAALAFALLAGGAMATYILF
jgi:hypothetical protein